jgi:signal transduction histidine kinase/CheY-like chemotaxis protein
VKVFPLPNRRVGITFDNITGRKRTEDEIIKAKENAELNERKLKEALEIGKMGSWELDITSGIFTFTDNFYKIFHTTARKMGGYQMTIADYATRFVYPEDAVKVAEETQLAIESNDPDFSKTLEHRILCMDGGVGYISVRFFIVKDEFGNTIKTYGVNQDITEKKIAEAEIIKAKETAEENREKIEIQNQEILFNSERLESLLKVSQFQTNSIQELLDFALTQAVNLTKSKIGYIYFFVEEKKQFILNSWSKEVMKECAVIDPQTVYELDKTGCWGEAVRQRKPLIMNDYQAENPLKKGTPDGHVKLEKFLTIPVIFDNRIVAVAGVANKLTDYNNSDIRQLTLLMDNVWKISERITLIKDLRSAIEKAEESDRLKSAFLANMSHEIRTPMNGILGFAELLKEQDLTGEEQSKYIGIIEKSGYRMLNIINDIIDISKIEARMVEMRRVETNVNEQIEYVYSFFKPEAEAKGLKLLMINVQVKKDETLLLDREKLYAVLTNLVKNAIKYTEKGEIEIGCVNKGHFLEFYVKDTGIGIPEERQQAVFERFIQADIEDKMARQGAGLGLAITKAYIDLMGGRIWLESKEGVGSIFYFTVPFDVKDEPTSEFQVNVAANEADAEASQLVIMIVEDDSASEILLERNLKRLVKKIIKAGTGSEAVELTRKYHDIDLIFMDIRLPGMDGYEATRKIREFNKDVVIIAQTAFGLAGDREKAIASGCNDYISKPINKEALHQLLYLYKFKVPTNDQ